MKYERIINAVFNCPWAILPEKLEAIAHMVAARIEGIPLEAQEGESGSTQREGSVAVINVFGTISQRANLFTRASGGTSTEILGEAIDRASRDETIKSIVLNIDSPGGNVYGVQEVADKIFQARERKPIYAIANPLAASAAYWIASAAEQVMVTPSGEAGSIGVVGMHVDQSGFNEQAGVKPTILSAGKFKAEANPHEPLGDEARQALQKRIDEYYDSFVKAIARNRGVSAGEVRNGFGEGRVLGATAAVSEGLADRVMTLDELLVKVGARRLATPRRNKARARLAAISAPVGA